MQLDLNRPTLDIAPNDENFCNTLYTAFNYCQNNQEMFHKQVLKALFEMQKDDNSTAWSEEEVEALRGCLGKVIDDNCLILNGKDKLVKADDCITQIAMVAWLMSPSQYECDQRTSTLWGLTRHQSRM